MANAVVGAVGVVHEVVTGAEPVCEFCVRVADATVDDVDVHALPSCCAEVFAIQRKRRLVDSIQAGSGAVFSLLPPENATGNFVKVVQRVPVKLVFEPGENAEHLLVPGMSVVPVIAIR